MREMLFRGKKTGYDECKDYFESCMIDEGT